MLGLNALQEKFCIEYVLHGNTIKAARNAGYCKKAVKKAEKEQTKEARESEHSLLRRQACLLLNKKEIKKRIEEITNENYKGKIADKEDALKFLSELMADKNAKDSDRIRAAELILRRYPVLDDDEKDEIIFER
jgi:phage terminase small subunit